jgi:glycosyltransferase involved in cell wall biosynthesis
VAPPLERVPPVGYGGTERIVDALTAELVRRGHDVTTFASGDSEVQGRLVPTVPAALRPAGLRQDPVPWFVATVQQVRARAAEFDVVHAHLETWGALLADGLATGVVHTFHGRLDAPGYRTVLERMQGRLVAISESQRRPHHDVPWAAVIYNGLRFAPEPPAVARGQGLCFVGRLAPEKGVVDAIAIATRTGRPLRIAAKVGNDSERAYYDEVFRPALETAGRDVEFLGELRGPERDALLAESYATLMPGLWPEPFGLVAIESLACGTPVVARAVGAMPEIIRDGLDGFLGDDVQHLAFQVDRCAALDPDAMRASVLERFSAERMADAYEALYDEVVTGAADLQPRRSTSGPGGLPHGAPATTRRSLRA